MGEGGESGARAGGAVGMRVEEYLALRHPRWEWFERLGVIVYEGGRVWIEPEGLRVLMAVAGVVGG